MLNAPSDPVTPPRTSKRPLKPRSARRPLQLLPLCPLAGSRRSWSPRRTNCQMNHHKEKRKKEMERKRRIKKKKKRRKRKSDQGCH